MTRVELEPLAGSAHFIALHISLLAAALALGCRAEITGSLGTASAGSPAQPGSDPKTEPAPLSCESPAPGPSPLRRLTHREYDNTTFDLLGDATRPAQQFAREEVFLGFDNN